MEAWRIAILDSFNQFLNRVITFLPNVLAMVTILIGGFLLAWLVKTLLLVFLKAVHFDRVGERWGLKSLMAKGGLDASPSSLASRFLFWLIALITLILAVSALELTATQKLVAQFFIYLPNLLAALLILVVGYLVALFLGQAVLIAAVNAQLDSARTLGRAVHWFIMVLVFTMALYHMGVAEKVLIAAFSILLGGTVLALAIAFGWGGREIARDFLEKWARKKKERDAGSDDFRHL
jgi:Mechanosensitive ion channel, conserved TM helix